jgi:hypothetical protein
MLSVNWKHVQLVKICMPCNFEVNLITHLGVIALFSSFFSSPGPKDHVRYCHHLASVVHPLNFSYFNLLLWNNLAVSIYVRSSIKFLHFVPFHQQIWPPRAILVSDWLLFKKIFSSETVWQNGAKLGRKHLCKILYKASSFGSIRPTNMATKINSF